jgi:hypothetical protein
MTTSHSEDTHGIAAMVAVIDCRCGYQVVGASEDMALALMEAHWRERDEEVRGAER